MSIKQGPMKRSRNEQMIESHVSLNHSTNSSESETDLKAHDEVDQRHKIEPESISVHPYISDSDINSNGEARKDYVFPDHPKPRGNPKDPIGAIVPNVFAKTSKTTGTSQIW